MIIEIKDMKMPTECEYCGFCRYYPENGNVWCNANNRILKLHWKDANWTHLDVERPDWCPLIEINTDGDTISRAEAIEIVNFECGEWKGLAQTIVNGLKKLSPKQSEKIPYKKPEIIKCKDCKHGDWYTAIDGKRFCYCMEHGSNSNCENDFCSRAERRNDERMGNS